MAVRFALLSAVLLGAVAGRAVGPVAGGPLADLVVARLEVSARVAAAKFGSGKAVDDPDREQQELTSVRERARALGVDPVRAAAFFRDQISASKIVQRGLIARWTAHPGEAPGASPDLDVIRAELDVLTGRLLDQLLADRGPHTVAPSVLDRLDNLRRVALRTALRSVT